MTQVQRTGTEADQTRRRRPGQQRRRRGVELTGLAIGIVAGIGITLAWLVPARNHAPAPSTQGPALIRGAAAQPDPAALDEEWVAYSDRSSCADWAGGDGVSALRLNRTQLAWFFSDTSIGPAGPTIGFSRLSGFTHNSLVVQTTTQTRTGTGSTFVTMTGGGACTGPGGPGNAAPVVGPPPAVPGGPSDRYWEEDGLVTGGTLVKFYTHYLAGLEPYVPVGTVIATFGVGQLSDAGHGPRYGAVARPQLIRLPSYTPPGGGSPILWGAALLNVGNTIYIYGTQSPNVAVPDRRLYLARVPVSQLTAFGAWQFYTGQGRWTAASRAGQQSARPIQPRNDLSVSSGFSVIQAGHRYWLIQADPLPGTADIDTYPARTPWGPFDGAAGRVLYRDPLIGLDAAHEYRIMYEARAEPALSTPTTLIISYNTNSEAVTTGCVPMSRFTNTVLLPRFVAVPLTALGPHPAGHARGGPSDYPPIVQQNPSQWFDAWKYQGDCPPVPAVTSVAARPGAGQVTLSWPGGGLNIRYRVYVYGPGQPGRHPVATTSHPGTAITGLRAGRYRAKVEPVNFYGYAGPSGEVTFTIP